VIRRLLTDYVGMSQGSDQMAIGSSGAVTPSLAIIRLLQGFGGKSVPVKFVANQPGLENYVARKHIVELEAQSVVKQDGDFVSIA
jgi:hypothetical protein